ncbi:hypothetical protein PABG_11448 [Paracoccidioides brasiliensis Pb03]|nr:hypothetical protein PABG_11448 [Paracoccidioides brasiliensis Pb03]
MAKWEVAGEKIKEETGIYGFDGFEVGVWNLFKNYTSGSSIIIWRQLDRNSSRMEEEEFSPLNIPMFLLGTKQG